MDEREYQRRKDAFQALVDLDPAAREPRLAEIASGDAELADVLRRQLHAAAQTVSLLDRVAGEAAVPEIARYHVVRELGRGGMGCVWLAERRLGDAVQPVALKRILHGAWTAEDRRRFERERRILAGLAHPNIAALVDGGTDADGAPYLATVYVDGERIDRHAERDRLDAQARVRLVAKVAAAVAHAHRSLVVHRDLKPANILVDREGEPKLLDFGIARLLGEDAITTTGASQMTLRYAAPEQVRGEADLHGGASDIYSLGVLLYELLAGESPYGASREQAALLAAILETTPSPPSRHRHLAGVDADLDAIVLKALRKQPHERYESADAFADDLLRWLRREPVAARRGERGYHARAFVRRRWPWIAAAALVMALVGYHVATLDAQLRRVGLERDKAQALAGYFGELFKEARPADTERGEISARELLERSVERLRKDDALAPATRATLLLAANDALAHLGQHRAGQVAVDAAMALLQAMPAPDPALLARAHSEHASNAYKLADLAGAREHIALALDALEGVDEPDLSLTVHQQDAVYAEEAGERERARAIYERVLAIARTRLTTPEGLRSYLAAQSNLALVELREDPARGEARLRDALAAEARHGPADRAVVLPIKSYLARTLVNQQRLAEARPLHEEVLREARAHYGRDDPWLDVIGYHYATLALLDGRAEEAIEMLDASIARRPQPPPDTDTAGWSNLAHRASAALAHGDWSDAIERFGPVLAWRERLGRGEGPAARFDRAQLAYARCRLDPNVDTRAALAAAMAHAHGWNGWPTWKSREFLPACEDALASR